MTSAAQRTRTPFPRHERPGLHDRSSLNRRGAGVRRTTASRGSSFRPHASDSPSNLDQRPRRTGGLRPAQGRSCTSLFLGKKPIRLPGDPSRTQRYRALNRGGEAFHTLVGDLRLTAAIAEQLRKSAAPGRAAYANTICLATISRGAVTKLKPNATNPLVGDYTAKIQIERFPAMHTAFDDELVLAWTDSASNMGAAYYPSLATLLGGDPIGRTWETHIHGTPSAGPPANQHLVMGGGGTC